MSVGGAAAVLAAVSMAAAPAVGLQGPAASPPAQPAGPAQTVVLTSAVFEGAHVVSADTLAGLWAPWAGKPVTLAALRGIARKVEAYYADHGYPFVAVVVPPQEIKDGVVHFQVLEGRIQDVTYLGSDPAARRQAAAIFAPLLKKQPVASGDLERAFLQAQAVPGLDVKTALGPTVEKGGMALVVETKHRAWTGYANVNDDYSKALGYTAMSVGAERDGDSLYGDMTTASLLASPDFKRQINGKLAYQRNLNADGTSLDASILVSDAKPRGGVSNLAIATKALNARLGLDQAIWQRKAFSANASLGLEWNDQSTDVFSSTAIGRDKLRVLSARLWGDSTTDIGHMAWSLEARQGLSALGASREGDPGLSRVGGDPQALVFKAASELEAPLPFGAAADLKLQGQYADRPLLVPEQFSIGNLSIVRGYDPGAYLGDQAVAGGIELRSPARPGPWGTRYSAFAFTEGAELWSLGAAPSHRWVASQGGGLRIDLPNRFRLELAYADPHATGGEKSPARFLFNFTTDLTGLGSRLAHAMPWNRQAPS
jgi:hemolysin activation/secretion protein